MFLATQSAQSRSMAPKAAEAGPVAVPWPLLRYSRGVTVIDRPGEKFDPNLENAVMQGTADEGEPGTVCAVLQKGYKMGDFVLRHAMVKVVEE